MNTWKTKVHFLIRYHSYFKILLKTTNKHIWKNLKNHQILSLDIVVFSIPQIRKIQAPQKKLGHWPECYDLWFLLIFGSRINGIVIMKRRKKITFLFWGGMYEPRTFPLVAMCMRGTLKSNLKNRHYPIIKSTNLAN